MCAIAGLVCLKGACPEKEHGRIVETMCAIQSHRGPDDRGVNSLGEVCLGSNRLSIIDLSKAGHMPMADSSENLWIVYNGETYNFQTLRAELIRCGHEFRSKTDTEVVLCAYKEWGEGCFERLAGMFAFAVYERRTDTLVLARDRFGKKPLYYTSDGKHVLFASELKALMRMRDKLEINRQRLLEWGLYRNIDFGSPQTLVEGISSLPAGHFLKIQRGRIGPAQRYYAVESEVDSMTYEQFSRQPRKAVVEEVESLVVGGVTDRLVSDVPLGVLCSGGVDSSLITSLCARNRNDVAAFHVRVAGRPEMDESPYAKKVADMLGIEIFTQELNRENFCLKLPRAVYHSDVPLTHPNSVAYLLVSELARKQGTIILLSGEAADELFGGYPHRYRRSRQLLKARQLFSHFPAKVRQIIGLSGHACNGVQATELPGYGNGLAGALGMLDGYARDELRSRCADAYRFVSNAGERALLAAMLADLTNFLSPLLRRLDRMSMAASVECRVPFLDHRLIKKVVNLPASYRLNGSTDKWILKEIASGCLPREIVYRKKLGFPLPLHDYLVPLAREDFFRDGFCAEFLGMGRQGLTERIANWKLDVEGFFTLLTLEIWGRLFCLRESLDAMTERMARMTGNGDVKSSAAAGDGATKHGIESSGAGSAEESENESTPADAPILRGGVKL